MADPLGLIGSGGGLSASRMNRVSSGRGRVDPSQPGFKDLLLKELNEVNKLQIDMNKATEDLMTGKRSDIENVIQATQQADTAFKMLQAVHNKVMKAYEEIKQIRV